MVGESASMEVFKLSKYVSLLLPVEFIISSKNCFIFAIIVVYLSKKEKGMYLEFRYS